MNRSACLWLTRVSLLAFVSTIAPVHTVHAQTTALFFHSEPGDYIGQGLQQTYTPADGTFQISRNYDNGVSVSVSSPTYSFWWYLDFAAAGDTALAVGAYESARRFPFQTGNGLSVSGSGRGCNELTGRYVVREIALAPDGTVLSFAADFEQHCEDGNPGLFGAIRYNSTISDLLPFAGNYPFYELTVTPPDHGRVTATGLDCGGAGTACVLTLPSATLVALTATPDTGYAFAGWSGDCSGAITTWIRVNQRKRCSASFEPGFQGTTALRFDSQPGDYIGQGLQRTYTPLDGTFQISRNYRNGVSVSITPPDSSFWWTLDFAAAGNVPLAVGPYGAAGSFSWSPLNGFRVYGSGRSCGELTGRFVVLEVVYDPGGTVLRFAADFEQHCSDAVPALFGAIRYNSTISDLTPFGGDYPVYRLSVSPPDHGRVTGGGIDCGGGNTVCEVSPAAAAHLTLTAQPDSGYVFTGWTGDCRGGPTTSVHVNGPKECSALFEPLVSASPRTVLYWHSQPGDYIGAGNQAVYSPLNSLWSVTSSGNGNEVRVSIEDAIDDWRLSFSAPEGQALTVGYYSAARRWPFTPFNGLDASGSGRGCNDLTGRFIILEIAIASDGTVQRFAADFEQHCSDTVPALFGAIRYNSTIDEVLPFGGTYPSYSLSLTPAANGHVTGTGVSCGAGNSQCELSLISAAQVTLTATPVFGYTFMGWTEDCSGGTTTTLHVNGPKRCAALFEPIAATAPRTVLRSEVPSGTASQGPSGVFSLGNSRWTPTVVQSGNSVRFYVESVGPRSDSYWRLEFYAPSGEVLQAGRSYTGAGSYPGPGVAALTISRNSSSCGGGEFLVREVSLGPQNTLIGFAAEFVLTCGQASPVLTGSLQYNSRIDVPATTLSVDPAALRFATLHNGSAVTLQPSPQSVRLTLSRPNVGWTATANQPWIQIFPSSGTGSSILTIVLNVLGGHPGSGSATGTITVALTDGGGASRVIDVSITMHLAGTTAPPLGVVDTPLQNSTGVTGAIPVTGWALDDLEVTGVTICRAGVGGEVPPVDANCAGAAQIFVGNGVFIEGARPDVQAAFPNYPRNNLGGWGFMLLTNMLPNQGNGTFGFYVYARDREGYSVLLGTRTITCANASATAPFGAIDTPGQGETVTSSAYVNFGWALTPNPKWIPVDGSTLMVYVDGVAVGNPSYNHYRADIAALFPNLANSNGAVGFRVLDTTTLADGLHTIVWTAADSAGVTSGLGSRYFRVASAAGASVATTTTAAIAVSAQDLAQVALDTSPVTGRRGWDADTPWRSVDVGRTGRAVVRGEELDRFELALGSQAGETYTGYLRVGDRLSPLPIGSRLDPLTGTFTWSPGVGFVGPYDLVFVRSAGGGPLARREVRIVLQPKGTGRRGAQVVIDTPQWQQDVAQPFSLAGWAVDLDAAAGTGMDSLHVWAYPLTGEAPVFLGTATYGGARPDVAAVHGEQFRESGYGLLVQGLTPGNYDLAVFAWSHARGDFMPAQVVRVTVR